MNIFTVDLWEKGFFDFLDPIKQAPALIGNLIFANYKKNNELYDQIYPNQVTMRSEENISHNDLPVRTASPVLVVQRTWENRSKDLQQVSVIDRAEARRFSPQQKTPPRSRSPSPIQSVVLPSRREKKSLVENNAEKNHRTKSNNDNIL